MTLASGASRPLIRDQSGRGMETVEQVAAAARRIGDGPTDLDRVGRARQMRAKQIAEALATKGFPESDAEKNRLSLAPLLFQEANYDDIDWTSQMADLRQLRDLFELDHLVQSGGLKRGDATGAAFADYVKASFDAIKAQRL